jgi:glycosyltransferase involved in cell wall biosynthesis
MLDNRKAIWSYIDQQLCLERREQEERARRKRARQTQYILKFLSQKLREFWWSFLTHAGLKHIHDGTRSLPQLKKQFLKFIASLPTPIHLDNGQKLYIETSHVISAQTFTGIQRVSWEYCSAFSRWGGAPIFTYDGKLYGVRHGTNIIQEIQIAPGDKLIFPDTWWADPEQTVAALRSVISAGGENILILHDIIPFLYHPICNGVDNFIAYFNDIMCLTSAVICVSKSVADEFIQLMSTQKKPFNPGLRVGWQWHGEDFSLRKPDRKMSRRLTAIFEDKRPIMLTVGTLEPRKGYPVALDAMEQLWRDGVDVRYVIVGVRGWLVSALERRIRKHAEYGRRLFWFDDLNDHELVELYQRARCFLYPSIAEGFGLPLVEAAHFGLPIIASDIPIFRELMNDYARFFKVTSSTMLAYSIREELGASKAKINSPFLSWAETTNLMRMMIKDGTYQYGKLIEYLR